MRRSNGVNIALVGCGAVSQLYYTPALKELERSEVLHVAALYDPSAPNLAKLHQSFPAATILKDPTEISSGQVDLAIVASPPQFHAPQSIQLLKTGVSVLCEKPMATSVREAEAMIKAAERSGALLAIGLFRRFFPATQAIHSILSLGVLGDITSFSFTEGHLFAWPVQSAAYFKKSTANGGILMDIGTHVLDLMLWWLGEPVEVLYEDDAMGGIEVNCRLQCHFANGATGAIRLSRDCVLPNRYVIQGTKGWLSWNVNEADGIQIGFADSQYALDARIHTRQSPLFSLGQPSYTFHQSFTSQICNIVAAVRGVEPVRIPGEQGIQSLRLIDTCYRERTLLCMPWLDEWEQVQARQLNNALR